MLNLNLKQIEKYSLKDTTVMWLDTETTGIDHYWCDMITACFLVEHSGQMVDTLEMKVQPFLWSSITKGAEAVHGITPLQMEDFAMPDATFTETFLPFLRSHWNKKQFILAGHNVIFDRNHLNSWWGKCKSKIDKAYYYSPDMLNSLSSMSAWFNENLIDTMLMAKFCQKHNITNFIDSTTKKKSVKLSTICETFEIQYDSHDAVDDIIATKIVAHRLWNRIMKSKNSLNAFKKQYPFMYTMFNEGHLKELSET